jgi:hypothetical protein
MEDWHNYLIGAGAYILACIGRHPFIPTKKQDLTIRTTPQKLYPRRK